MKAAEPPATVRSTVTDQDAADWDAELALVLRGNRLAPLPPVRRHLSRRAVAWVRAHWVTTLLLFATLAIGAVVIAKGITGYPSYGDDEGTYTAEAWAFIDHGHLSHYTYWYDHPPLGWIQLGIMMKLFGWLVRNPMAVASSRELMLIPAMATLTLMFVLCRRVGMSRGFAALAPALLFLSPLGLTGLREVYLENFAIPWVLAAFVFATTNRRRLWMFCASGVCIAIAVLSKETMALFLPGLAYACAQNTDRRTRTFCMTAFVASAVLLIGLYPLYALIKGELIPGHGHVSLWYGITWQLLNRQASGSILTPGSSARVTLDGWLHFDPWLLAIGVGAMVPALLSKRLRPLAITGGLAAAEVLHGGYLPIPFVIGLLPFCALLTAGVLDAIWQLRLRAIPDWLPRVAALVMLGGLVAAVAPSWARGDKTAMTNRVVGTEYMAEQWVYAHVPRGDRILVDDTMYLDMVHHGFAPRYGVIWFYKLGTDPAVTAHLHHGWKSIDYVISSPALRSGAAAQHLTGVLAALQHSRIVAYFGYGGGNFVIRKVQP